MEATYVDDVSGLTGCNGTGTFTRTWTLLDACLNDSIQVQTIMVEDTTNPTFTIPNDTIVYYTTACQLDTATTFIGTVSNVNDNCPDPVSVTYVDDLSGLDQCSNTGSFTSCLLYTSPSPRDKRQSRMPSSA